MGLHVDDWTKRGLGQSGEAVGVCSMTRNVCLLLSLFRPVRSGTALLACPPGERVLIDFLRSPGYARQLGHTGPLAHRPDVRRPLRCPCRPCLRSRAHRERHPSHPVVNCNSPERISVKSSRYRGGRRERVDRKLFHKALPFPTTQRCNVQT